MAAQYQALWWTFFYRNGNKASMQLSLSDAASHKWRNRDAIFTHVQAKDSTRYIFEDGKWVENK